tara:strand:- start:56 stop:670 length:615 start_codon:yes stop_codon:yes gene_type:complete
MKKLMVMLLSIIVVTLIAGSVQYVDADHLEPGQGIFKDAEYVNLIDTNEVDWDSKYQIYLQIQLRNGDGQLINVSQSTAAGAFIRHELTDHVFDTLMGEKEIVVIDNIKYEKIQYVFNPTLVQRFIGIYPIFSEMTVEFKVEESAHAKMNEKKKDYSIWKIHYCATWEGHGFRCLPVFQVLIPTLTLEPSDTPTQQWTILRELS